MFKKNVAGQTTDFFLATAQGTTVTSGTFTLAFKGDGGQYSAGTGTGVYRATGGTWQYTWPIADTNYNHLAAVGTVTTAIPHLVNIYPSPLEADFTTTRGAYIDNLSAGAVALASVMTATRGAYLDAAISSRAAIADWTTTRGAYIDNLSAGPVALASVWTATRGAYIDVAISSRADGAVWSPTIGAYLDAAVSSRADKADWTSTRGSYLDAAISTRADAATWTSTRGAYLDAAITSRAAASDWTPTKAGYIISPPSNWSALSISAGGIAAADVQKYLGTTAPSLVNDAYPINQADVAAGLALPTTPPGDPASIYYGMIAIFNDVDAMAGNLSAGSYDVRNALGKVLGGGTGTITAQGVWAGNGNGADIATKAALESVQTAVNVIPTQPALASNTPTAGAMTAGFAAVPTATQIRDSAWGNTTGQRILNPDLSIPTATQNRDSAWGTTDGTRVLNPVLSVPPTTTEIRDATWNNTTGQRVLNPALTIPSAVDNRDAAWNTTDGVRALTVAAPTMGALIAQFGTPMQSTYNVATGTQGAAILVAVGTPAQASELANANTHIGQVKTVADSISTVATKQDTTLEADGEDWKFSAAALVESPVGTGGFTSEDRAMLETAANTLDADLTGHTVPTSAAYLLRVNLDAKVSEAGGGTPLTAQQTRDAMKLAPSSGTLATGSIDKQLDDIQTKTDSIVAGRVVVYSAIAATGDVLTLIVGDAYNDERTQTLVFIDTGDDWPDLTLATVHLSIVNAAEALELSVLCTVGTSGAHVAVSVELGGEDTAALTAGTHHYDVRAEWAGGDHKSLVSRSPCVIKLPVTPT